MRGRPRKYDYANKKCFDIYKRKLDKGIKSIDYQLFEKWYEEKEKRCAYCFLTEQESEILYKYFPESTRGGKRGKSLELERKTPTPLYDNIENFDLACYWCNNAKSNYFTEEEFVPIANSIGAINKARLSEISKKNSVM